MWEPHCKRFKDSKSRKHRVKTQGSQEHFPGKWSLCRQIQREELGCCSAKSAGWVWCEIPAPCFCSRGYFIGQSHILLLLLFPWHPIRHLRGVLGLPFPQMGFVSKSPPKFVWFFFFAFLFFAWETPKASSCDFVDDFPHWESRKEAELGLFSASLSVGRLKLRPH